MTGFPEITIEAPDFKVLARDVRQSKRVIAAESMEALSRVARYVKRQAQHNLQAQDAIDTYNLYDSIETRVKPFEAVVFTNEDYAVNVEKGRKKGEKMPPEGSLLEWMARHGIPAEAEFVIRRSIKVRGIEARPFLQPALVQSRRVIEKEFTEAGRRIIVRLLK